VGIASSDVLHLAELAGFMKERFVVRVALISEQRAGKTTLLGSLFERFCKGPFAGFSFIGSRTLVGFAKLHFMALLSSGGREPTVPRTSRQDPTAYFHLRLQDRNGANVDLIMSDRSGEVYEDARMDTDLIPDLEELPVAMRACFLLDGAKLAAKETRPAYSRQFKQLIHALNDNGALQHMDYVEVLSTKFDVTQSQEAASENEEYLAMYEKQLVREFAERNLVLKCYRICALPKEDMSVGFKGLDDLVQRWTKSVLAPSVEPRPCKTAVRQIDKYLDRVARGHK
jgi:hypothetical protein